MRLASFRLCTAISFTCCSYALRVAATRFESVPSTPDGSMAVNTAIFAPVALARVTPLSMAFHERGDPSIGMRICLNIPSPHQARRHRAQRRADGYAPPWLTALRHRRDRQALDVVLLDQALHQA